MEAPAAVSVPHMFSLAHALLGCARAQDGIRLFYLNSIGDFRYLDDEKNTSVDLEPGARRGALAAQPPWEFGLPIICFASA